MKLRWLLALLLMMTLFSSALIYASSPDDSIITVNDEDDETETEDDETETTESEDEEEDEELEEEEIEDAYERQVQFEQNNREFQMESELKNGENKDKMKVKFHVGGGDEPEIKLEYETETDSSEIELEYRVEFDKIIEFEESSAVLSFDENDTVVSEYELDKHDWDDIVYSTSTDVNGAVIYSATAATSDGVFILRILVTGSIAEVNGTTITPNAIKIDVEIHNYDFNSNSSYLALETDVKSETESDYEEEEESEDEAAGFAANEAQVAIGNANANGFFSWVETAMADGTEVSVISSGLLTESVEVDDDDIEGEQKGTLYFTFDAQTPLDIVWDPKVGVVSEGTASIIAAAVAAGLGSEIAAQLPGFELIMALMSLIGLSMILVRRRAKTL